MGDATTLAEAATDQSDTRRIGQQRADATGGRDGGSAGGSMLSGPGRLFRLLKGSSGGWLVAAMVAALSLVMAPDLMPAGVRHVPPQDLALYPASKIGLPRTPVPGEPQIALSLANAGSDQITGVIGQLHWNMGSASATQAILVPSSGRPLLMFVNGVPVGGSSRQPLPGPVQGAFMLSGPVPPNLLVESNNRLDLILGAPVWARGVPLVLEGSLEGIKAASDSWRDWMGFVRLMSLLAGVGALACVLAGLVLGRNLEALAVGAVVAVLLLWQVWAGTAGAELGSGLLVGGWQGPLLLLTGLAGLAAALRLAALERALFGGLAGATALAGALAVAVSAGLDGWVASGILVPGQIAFASVAPVLLAGLGLPVVLMAGSRALIEERRAARAEAVAQAALLDSQARELRRQEELRAVLEERQRFTRDIHDGIGGQLLSLLWRVRGGETDSDEIAGEIERGIADLRLVADALHESSDSLAEALENFAARARQQLDAVGIAFDWDMPADLDVRWEDQRRILSLYRILQEAVSNAVRHSRAAQLTIGFEQLASGQLRVRVEDDGIGIDPAAPQGRGLANMRARAAQLGGTLALQPSSSGRGTCILIELPPTVASLAS